MVLEGLRAEVVVDLENGTVSSQRAIRRWSGEVEDIENVRVPSRGPIVLTLRPGVPRAGSGLWPGQILTGVYADRRGSRGRAVRLAEALGLEVVSPWPQVRPGFEATGDIFVRGVRFDLLKSRSGVVIWVTVTMCSSVLAVVVVATLVGR